MKLDIVIPTLNRRKKLTNCINSILKSAKDISINLYIYFSDKKELDYFSKYFNNINEIKLKLIDEYRVPDFWNNYLKNCSCDTVCYINDDIEFFDETLEMMFKYYQLYFPGYDGVMGLTQTNIPHSQAVEGAFGVIGIKYADRFPDKQVFCPDYNRFFADFEMWQYAKSIGKFKLCEEVKILHLHPAFTGELPDETHKEVRQYLKKDREIFQERQKKQLLWGTTFETLKQKER